MKKITKFFVTYWSPGSFFAEESSKRIETLDPDAIEWPDDAYSFTLHRRVDVEEDDGTIFTGKSEQVGPRYYHPASAVLSLDDVKRRPEFCRPTSFLASNMEGNGWTHVVLSRWGNWPQPFEQGKDVVMPVTALADGGAA